MESSKIMIFPLHVYSRTLSCYMYLLARCSFIHFSIHYAIGRLLMLDAIVESSTRLVHSLVHWPSVLFQHYGVLLIMGESETSINYYCCCCYCCCCWWCMITPITPHHHNHTSFPSVHSLIAACVCTVCVCVCVCLLVKIVNLQSDHLNDQCC